jgi:hypothetical protein
MYNMNEVSKRWLEAAKVLSKDVTAKISCPECSKGVLLVKDEEIDDWNKIDRYLICNNCGRWEVITMNRPT